MALRKFNFDDADPVRANEVLRAAVEGKLQKMERQSVKLVADEKRWLRKKRLANTKLLKITRAKRTLRRKRNAFAAKLKGK